MPWTHSCYCERVKISAFLSSVFISLLVAVERARWLLAKRSLVTCTSWDQCVEASQTKDMLCCDYDAFHLMLSINCYMIISTSAAWEFPARPEGIIERLVKWCYIEWNTKSFCFSYITSLCTSVSLDWAFRFIPVHKSGKNEVIDQMLFVWSHDWNLSLTWEQKMS